MDFLQELPTILSGGAFGAVLAGLLYRFLPQKFIDLLFFKRQENYKAQLNQELETHKKKLNEELQRFNIEKSHDFDILLKRKISWHEKELEVLAEAWQKINDANSSLLLVFPMFSFMKTLDGMSEKELEKFFIEKELSYEDKEHVRKGNPDKSRAYKNIEEKRQLIKAFEAFNEFTTYLSCNIIFMRLDIKEKFIVARDAIRYLAEEKNTALQEQYERGFFERDFYKEFHDHEEKIRIILEDLQEMIRKELFPDAEKPKKTTKPKKPPKS